MPDWIEFHDSVVTAVQYKDADCELALDASVHRWESRGDRWVGTGWRQPVRLMVWGAVGSRMTTTLPAVVSEGHVRLGEIERTALVRLPLESSDGIALSLQLATGNSFNVRGRGLQVEPAGSARYVEDLPEEFLPQELKFAADRQTFASEDGKAE